MSAVNFLWNPLNDNIVEEFDDAGNTVAEYTTESDQFGNLVSQYRDGQERFFHYDGIGSTLALTDASGTVTDTRSYSAFGTTTEESGNMDFPFQYVGQKGYYWDSETEHDVRQRPYQTRRVRWLAVDPINYHNSEITPYAYCRNRPLIYQDPSGLKLGSYGNYCGPGNKAPAPPIDVLDTCCQTHDACYATCGVKGVWGVLGPNACARKCDWALCKCTYATPCPILTISCNAFQAGVRAVFCCKGLNPF